MRVLASLAEAPSTYPELLALVGRLHRGLLAIVHDELRRHERHDVNPTQALLLHALGDNEVTAGTLAARGYYLGSNVSYNLKKLVADGLLERRASTEDARAVYVRLSPRGHEVRELLERLFARQAESLGGAGGVNFLELAAMTKLMRRLERFWIHQLAYRP